VRDEATRLLGMTPLTYAAGGPQRHVLVADDVLLKGGTSLNHRFATLTHYGSRSPVSIRDVGCNAPEIFSVLSSSLDLQVRRCGSGDTKLMTGASQLNAFVGARCSVADRYLNRKVHAHALTSKSVLSQRNIYLLEQPMRTNRWYNANDEARVRSSQNRTSDHQSRLLLNQLHPTITPIMAT